MAKKLDEIKEAISANSTPVKTNSGYGNDSINEDEVNHEESGAGGQRTRRVSSDMDLWGRLSESRKSSYNNLVPLGEHSSTTSLNNGYPTLPENLYSFHGEVSFVFILIWKVLNYIC